MKSLKTVSNETECTTEENEGNSCVKKTSFNSRRDKTKSKKSRKRQEEDDVSVATDKDPSDTVEDSLDDVCELNDAKKEKRRKQKREKKKVLR